MSNELLRSAPEAQGIPSAAILSFLDAADKRAAAQPGDAVHSLTLVRHGHVVAGGWWRPYRSDRQHRMFSISKSFTSTAVGLAVADGLLSVDDDVLRFFPDERPAQVSDQLAAMRVRHLLTMTTGHAEDTVERMTAAADGNWVREFLSLAVAHEPGATFVYNSGATYLLSAIVQRLTGQTVLDYLGPRLFAPLGFVDPVWSSCPRGITTGGWGLSVRTAELARFGQLYLDEGRWRGAQLVPRDWVLAATAWQTPNSHDAGVDWQQGYGYQFWRCRYAGAYRGDGAFGQFCVVFPEHDAVLALTGGVNDMQAVLDLVWEHVLPALGEAALPPDPSAERALTDRLAALELPAVVGRPAGPTVPVAPRFRVTAQPADPQDRSPMDHTGLPPLQAIGLAPGPDGWTLTFTDGATAHELRCGDGRWIDGTLALGGTPVPVAASGGWVAGDTFTARMAYVDTPFIRTFTAVLHGRELTLRVRDNVSFTSVDQPAVIGRAD